MRALMRLKENMPKLLLLSKRKVITQILLYLHLSSIEINNKIS